MKSYYCTKRIRATAFFCALLVFICSCATIEELSPAARPASAPHSPSLVSGNAAIWSRIQSDKRSILFGSVSIINGVPNIGISKDCADSLGIPGEKYDKYVSEISSVVVF